MLILNMLIFLSDRIIRKKVLGEKQFSEKNKLLKFRVLWRLHFLGAFVI
jgi:hypothetical protein